MVSQAQSSPQPSVLPLSDPLSASLSIACKYFAPLILNIFTHYVLLYSWRDCGKESLPEPNTPQPQQLLSPPPPPLPYQQGEWQPAAQVVVTPPSPVQVTPRSVRKSRQLQVASPSKRPIVHHRKSRSRVLASSPPIPTTPTPYFPPPQSEFSFCSNQEVQVEQTPLEDKVSSSLIYSVDQLTLTVIFSVLFRWIG